MSDTKHKRRFWYTRRDGVVRGPYPEKQISRYILLGRICEIDELRPENGAWATLKQYPQLIPEVMQLPPTDENLQKLVVARLHEDERRPRDRREAQGTVSRDILDRRSGTDRRRPEPEEVMRFRELKYQVSHTRPSNAHQYRYPLVFAAIVLLGFVLSLLLEKTRPDFPVPDCAAGHRPGVNWNHCNLSGLDSERANLVGAHIRNARLDAANLRGASLTGADLEYSSINLSDFSGADLSHASLVGTTARGADLRNARFKNANLAYANLSDARLEGADLSGADLSNAIWIDRKPCLAGSVGACKRAGPSR